MWCVIISVDDVNLVRVYADISFSERQFQFGIRRTQLYSEFLTHLRIRLKAYKPYSVFLTNLRIRRTKLYSKFLILFSFKFGIFNTMVNILLHVVRGFCA